MVSKLPIAAAIVSLVICGLTVQPTPVDLEVQVVEISDDRQFQEVNFSRVIGRRKKKKTKAQRDRRREVLNRRNEQKRARKLSRFCQISKPLTELDPIRISSGDDLPPLNISYDQVCNPGFGGSECSVTWSSWMAPPNKKVFENNIINETYITTIPKVPGTVVPPTARTIADIGAGKGFGSIQMGYTLYKNQKGGMVVAIDTWTGTVPDWTSNITLTGGHPHLYETFYSNVVDSGLGDYVFPFATTEENAARFFRKVAHFDIVRVTESSDNELFSTIRTWWASVKIGGRVQGSDYGTFEASILQFARSIDCTLHVTDSGDWFLTKLADAKQCILAFPDKQFQPGWDFSFECHNSSCNGGFCARGLTERCSCPVGRGGQKCQISRSFLNPNNINPFYPEPEERFRDKKTDGWNADRSSFEEIFLANNITTVVDVGVWQGGSSITMAKLLKEKGNGGIVISVDPWSGSVEHWKDYGPKWNSLKRIEKGFPMLFEVFRSNVIREGFTDYITPFPVPSKTAAEIFKKLGFTADLVHIDASHEYDAVLQDLHEWWPVVSPGGFIYGDDYASWAEVRAAVDEFAANEVQTELQFYGKGKMFPKVCNGCKFAIPKPVFAEIEEKNDRQKLGVMVGDPAI
eukprot:TRINITY_DN21696_c0_g1_i1.p1 TRINITY_DN21696_c0_g1~~TRINITY_DN21696_c0_g1_i1.p1  ORF type:complete len:632 (+),score=134.88 TRINITY_DN21696_c0_g1_i1:40-1935(+)